ncbi:MAG: type IV secretion system DNA-binding domain-containing protein [Deltaproteobacteria bacterium]|jgi:intracellular multiplication protein IcmO|nr:type IV secretion system DNA-binding domain-containing protein [Deltaproteobacteria bacterium]
MSHAPPLKGLDPKECADRRRLVRDTRAHSERFADFLSDRGRVLPVMGVMAALGFMLPSLSFPAFLLTLLLIGCYLWLSRKAALPFRLPAAAKRLDPHSAGPGHLYLKQAGGVFFMGNEASSGKELWLENGDILTHMLLLGTTGSGKTAALESLAFNALATGSGLFYIDPKAVSQLNMEIWQMARMLGRDDDFRVLNYATHDPGAKCVRLSNTNNPFSVGHADALAQVLGSLIPPSQGSANSIFADKAMALISGLMYALCDLRDQGRLALSVKKVREYLSPTMCMALLRDPHLSNLSRDALKAALLNCNFSEHAFASERDQPPSFYEQYGYAQSYFGRALSSLTDTYEHIYGVENGEVDFQDVVLNRRILLTLLPSMEKSPTELLSLGKITLSSLRNAAATGLGLRIEGTEREVLGSLPAHFRRTGPFLSIVDEYSAIVTPGFEMLLTQGRGLGIASVVASQDYAGIVEADPKGAQQIVANTNVKVFMKLAEAERTWRLLRDLTGEEQVMETSGYTMEQGPGINAGAYRDGFGARAANRPLVALADLLEQNEGEAHCLLGGKLARARLFHAGPSTKGAVMRVPRLLEMEPLADGVLKPLIHQHDTTYSVDPLEVKRLHDEGELTKARREKAQRMFEKREKIA